MITHQYICQLKAYPWMEQRGVEVNSNIPQNTTSVNIMHVNNRKVLHIIYITSLIC